MNENTLVNISQASDLFCISRQAIMQAISKKRLSCYKKDGKWVFTVKDWKDYEATKYDRKFSKIGDDPLFSEGEISVSMASKMLGVDKNHIYHCIRKGLIECSRTGHAYVLNEKQVMSNKHEILRRDPHKKFRTQHVKIRVVGD